MSDRQHHNEQQEERRDLDVPEKDAEDVKGGRRKAEDGTSPYLVITLKEGLITN